jgi:type II secretory ATPase GspE/PulE/Tfp pilus assembly ATPase PilB-like protein
MVWDGVGADAWTLRERIVAGASALELGRVAQAGGMRTLRRGALALAARGVTSVEEVLRVTPVDPDATS